MEVLNAQTFKSKVFNYDGASAWKFEGHLPTIVDFYADWCGPCRALSPVMEEIAKDYAGRVNVYKVDTEASPELAALFGIRGIPSVLFIPMNGEPAMSSGFMAKESFQNAIKDLFKIDP